MGVRPSFSLPRSRKVSKVVVATTNDEPMEELVVSTQIPKILAFIQVSNISPPYEHNSSMYSWVPLQQIFESLEKNMNQ